MTLETPRRLGAAGVEPWAGDGTAPVRRHRRSPRALRVVGRAARSPARRSWRRAGCPSRSTSCPRPSPSGTASASISRKDHHPPASRPARSQPWSSPPLSVPPWIWRSAHLSAGSGGPAGAKVAPRSRPSGRGLATRTLSEDRRRPPASPTAARRAAPQAPPAAFAATARATAALVPVHRGLGFDLAGKMRRQSGPRHAPVRGRPWAPASARPPEAGPRASGRPGATRPPTRWGAPGRNRDAPPQPFRPAAGRARLRPSGRRVAGPGCRPEELVRARHRGRRGSKTPLSPEREVAAVRRLVQPRPQPSNFGGRIPADLCRARCAGYHPGVGAVAERSKAHAWKVCRRETVSRVRIPPAPPSALAKAFSRSGCGRIFPLFSRVMQDGLSTGLCANGLRSGLSGRIFSGPLDCSISV